MPIDADAPMIARCLRGEAAAWDELFCRHYDPTARFVFQLSGDFTREDAAEITQETFLSVVQNLATFKGTSQLQTWIFRIAANKARDVIEMRHAAKRGSGQTIFSLQAEDPQTGLTPDAVSPLPSPADLLQRAETAETLTEAMGHISALCREVIELRYFGDLSYDEISKELELNAKTVSSRLSKCLDRLEDIMQQLLSRKGFPAQSVQPSSS